MAKTEKFELKTKISEELLAELAIKQADKKVEYNAKKLKLSNIRSQYNKEIIALDEEITELANQVHTKHHVEKLECPLNPLPASKRMELLHPNTGVVVHTRQMTADEQKQGYLFEGVNDPEESKKNAKAHFKGKDDEDGTAEEDGPNTVGMVDGPAEQPDSVGDIEAGGETFDKKAVKETPIKFDKDLDFGGVVKVAQDDGDGFHFGYRIASTRAPKASYALQVFVNSLTFTDYNVMLKMAGDAMISRLTSDPKFSAMGVDRTRKITETIEAFCAPEAAQAVAAD